MVVEDGTGLVDANSYISVEEADAYHLSYGNTGWDGVEDKELLLRLASRDLDIIYGARFASTPLTGTQGLYWPRKSFTAGNGFSISGSPAQLRAATAELALIEKGGSVLAPDDFAGNISKSTKKVGDLEKSIEYFGPNPSATSNRLHRVTAILRPLFDARASSNYATILL